MQMIRLIGAIAFLSLMTVGAPADTTPAAPQVSERQKNLLMQLSNSEANIQTINKALKQTGYKVGVAYDRIAANQKGNEMMDRNGGGPVRWDAFYGRTARDFYAPESWGTLHAEGKRGTVDIQVAENYKQIKRPPQFDFIYRANSDQIARAGEQIASLKNNQAALLARRQFHETEQSRLWATLSWDRVKDLELGFQPMYRFRLKPAGADAAVLQPIIQFMRSADQSIEAAQAALKVDQASAFAKLNDAMSAAYSSVQRDLADALFAPDLKPDHKKRAESLKAICKQMAEECGVIGDNYQKAIDSDKANEDSSKLQYRGELQQSLAFLAAALGELDQQINATAKTWGLSPDNAVAMGNAPAAASPTPIPATPANIPAPSPVTPHPTPVVPSPAPSIPAPTPASPTGHSNILLFIGNRKEEAAIKRPNATIRVVEDAESANGLANPDGLERFNVIVLGRNTMIGTRDGVFTDALWARLNQLMQAGADLVIFEQGAGNAEQGHRLQQNWQFIETTLGVKRGGGGIRGAIVDPSFSPVVKAAGLEDSKLAEVPFQNDYKLPISATILVRGISNHEKPVVAVVPVGKGRLVLIGNNTDTGDELMNRAIFDYLYPAGR